MLECGFVNPLQGNMLGTYCRNYRLAHGATLRDIERGENVKALSAFEMGRSTNIDHFMKYLRYSMAIGDVKNFLSNIEGDLNGAV